MDAMDAGNNGSRWKLKEIVAVLSAKLLGDVYEWHFPSREMVRREV
jgi:hypothetical protein